jgi:hypothetical protein
MPVLPLSSFSDQGQATAAKVRCRWGGHESGNGDEEDSVDFDVSLSMGFGDGGCRFRSYIDSEGESACEEFAFETTGLAMSKDVREACRNSLCR